MCAGTNISACDTTVWVTTSGLTGTIFPYAGLFTVVESFQPMVSNVVAWRMCSAAWVASEACYPMPGVAKAPFCIALYVCMEH